jgi:hypothetical protein
METLCPTTAAFKGKHRVNYVRTTVMDLAYLFGNVTDLRAADIKTHATLAAKTYFGAETLALQSQSVIEVLARKDSLCQALLGPILRQEKNQKKREVEKCIQQGMSKCTTPRIAVKESVAA